MTIVRRNHGWILAPRRSDLALLTLLGVSYTAFSETLNLARGAWAYSELMPLLPGTSIGIVPLAQWLLLPSTAVLLAARLERGRPN